MFIKPRDGYVVRDPVHRRALPPEGASVPDNLYWHQRLLQGDVELAEESVPEAEQPATQE